MMDLGSVYLDVKYFLSENIFKKIIFSKNIFCQKYFMIFTVRTEQSLYIYIYIYIYIFAV
jgi:hypothetical protein